MSAETTAAIAKSCAARWTEAMGAGGAVRELLEARLIDVASIFGSRVLTGVLVDREGVRALRMVASSPTVYPEDIEQAKRALQGVR